MHELVLVRGEVGRYQCQGYPVLKDVEKIKQGEGGYVICVEGTFSFLCGLLGRVHQKEGHLSQYPVGERKPSISLKKAGLQMQRPCCGGEFRMLWGVGQRYQCLGER